MKDAKYLLAYLVPLSTALGLWLQHGWEWATVVLVFALLPLIELWTPQSTENVAPAQEASRSRVRFFDWLLYANAPVLFAIMGGYLWVVYTVTEMPVSTLAGLTLSTGIVVGTCGINVAHELGHRSTRFEQWLSQAMLLPALYQHFFIEHNRGHHKNVATDLDPATARRGEVVYLFWARSIAGSWLHAWALEGERLQRTGLPVWSHHNQMLRFQVYQASWLAFVCILFNVKIMLCAIGAALVGILLLETVNYLEHYGLQRRRLDSGHYEPVSPAHSWNSNHELGRIFLYELTRHSDHHYKANRKYQVLRHMPESPQLPFGYPTTLLMALLPPLWFRVMNPNVDKNIGNSQI